MPRDKQMHFGAGFIVSLLGCLCYDGNLGLALAILAGAAKELYDYYHQDRHSVELADFTFTVAGGAIAVLLWFVGRVLLNK